MSKRPDKPQSDSPEQALERQDQARAAKLVDPDLVRQILQLQVQELGIRQEEVTIRKQEIGNTHEYAKLSLDAQVQDLEKERQHRQRTRRDRLLFAGFIVILLTGFVITALFLNKDQIAIEVLKAMVFLLSGGLGGYALHTRREKDSGEDFS